MEYSEEFLLEAIQHLEDKKRTPQEEKALAIVRSMGEEKDLIPRLKLQTRISGSMEMYLGDQLEKAYRMVRYYGHGGAMTRESEDNLRTAGYKYHAGLTTSRKAIKNGVRAVMLNMAQAGKRWRESRACLRCASKYFYKQSRCSNCNEVWYCSKGCQRAHWMMHKAVC
jgi:hypothetical protein